MARSLNKMQGRFRGALIGVLVGDCYGAPFEGQTVISTTLADQLEKLTKTTAQDILRFTDDTCMTKATCRSLITNKGLNVKHLAQEYTETYFKEPNRGYGAAVRQVFAKLRQTKYKDPFQPAASQFDGSGSFGNGAAMRCNGIALFAHKNKLNERQTIDLVENASKITHSHPYAIQGATLLCIAIKYVLSLDEDSLSESEFMDYLIRKMQDVETDTSHMFTNKLVNMKNIIDQLSISGKDVSQKEIVSLLGNDVSAQGSVPLAIYSFLRGISKFTDSYRIENEFIRTLHWAISCGGDTDTIASMACGLCGAYLSIDKIPENFYKKCESWDEMILLADKLAS